MNIGQLGFILYFELYVDKTELCQEEGAEKTTFSYIIHCSPYLIGAAIILRGFLVGLQIYFIFIVRQHWINKRDGRGDATLKYRKQMPDYLQAHQDFNEELNVEHYQRLAEQGLVGHSEITGLTDSNKLDY